MSIIETLVTFATPVIYPLVPSSRIFVLYLVSAVALAALAWHMQRKRSARTEKTRTIREFARWCAPKDIYTHRSAIVDYQFYAITMVLYGFGVIPVLIGGPTVSAWAGQWLSQGFGENVRIEGEPAIAVEALYTAIALIAFDLGTFAGHWLQHRVPWLWEFHKVHHSAQVLTPITAYRMHPTDVVVSGVCVAITTGTVQGCFVWATGTGVNETLVLGLNAGLFAFYLGGFNLRHSHVWLDYPRWMGWVLVSPAQHQIHHSSDPIHFDRNFGFILSWWDRATGTLYVPAQRENLELGLGQGEDKDYNSVGALYIIPFMKIARRWKRK